MAKETYRQKAKSDKNIVFLVLRWVKKPPQAIDIEEAVLGALMLEPNAISDILIYY